ncbi:hypothetical protein [Uliginosibacterium sp. 31-12]|uniref:hypothetical protein n=1 Tax=Uliginosibacterium sp. 31-12 TaxID=3062781 RepID=UPI0026E2ABDE|nr:hypothetical protein [Uliginosibacterium sp. 31-12]MDO6385578.1 hypothetical protein [Uliginosibacterium sp. 31-12]
MQIETVFSCPLGHKCEEARDGKIHRCAWLIELQGRNPNTGEEKPEKGCAMKWIPVLLVETAGAARGTSAAVESFRNEMVAGQQETAKALSSAWQATSSAGQIGHR